MNQKEKELYRIVDCVVSCCAMNVENGQSITRDELLGPRRTENLVMTRCILIEQVLRAGYSVTTLACLLHRSAAAVRHLRGLGRQLIKTSFAYRVAYNEAEKAVDSTN